MAGGCDLILLYEDVDGKYRGRGGSLGLVEEGVDFLFFLGAEEEDAAALEASSGLDFLLRAGTSTNRWSVLYPVESHRDTRQLTRMA